MNEQTNAGTEAVEEVKVVAKKGKANQTGDLIADIAADIGSYDKTKALKQAKMLADDIETNYFKLGGVLLLIRDNSWFEQFDNFEDYVSESFGFEERKARYLIKIYATLTDKMIPWDKVSGLGWTKLKDLVDVLTLENVDEWVAKASGVSVKELQAMLKADKNGESTEGSNESTQILVKKFKLINDQAETVNSALQKAKGEVGTEFDEVALESICGAYLGNAIVVQPNQVDIKAALATKSWEDAVTALSEAFPDLNITVDVKEGGGIDVKIEAAA